MSRREDTGALCALAQLVLDQRLGRLRDAASQLEKSRAQLAGINADGAAADLPTVAAGLVDLRYQRWADIRRAGLNAAMARQSASLIEARVDAATAFGRLQALQAVAARLVKKT